jgi:uncharacterized protein
MPSPDNENASKGGLHIWIDGDACPKVIKDLLYRAAIRTQTHLIVVSNHTLVVPPSAYIKRWQVGAGFDVADNYIVDNMAIGDLVITADIPLADAVVSAGGLALNPRGELYTSNNIKQHLAVRNLNESLRSCQKLSGGPEQFSQKEIQRFANSLDRLLAKQIMRNL